MALRDVDLSVRVNAIHVIAEIDKTGILADDDEEQRLKVARLVFDAEPRVRKAAGGFLRGLWEERAEKVKADWEGARGNKKKRGAKIDEETMAGHLEWKALASLLVETSTALDKPSEDPAAGPSRPNVLLAPQGQVITTRASAAFESLAPEIEKVQDWEGLVDYLLLDHSTADQDAWLLDEDEENFMIQLLIACINHEDKVSWQHPWPLCCGRFADSAGGGGWRADEEAHDRPAEAVCQTSGRRQSDCWDLVYPRAHELGSLPRHAEEHGESQARATVDPSLTGSRHTTRSGTTSPSSSCSTPSR
jgi:hypothetical protein